MAKTEKNRYWSFVGYEDSLPSDWIEQLQATGLPFAISPYHDKDQDPTGAPKKPHYHVILCWSGPTTFNQASKIVVDQLHQPIPIPLQSVIGMYRYFTHADNPDKFQYDKSLIRSFNGFDPSNFTELSKSQARQIKKELMQLIRDNRITEYFDLMNVIVDFGLSDDHYDVASSNTIFLTQYIKGCWRSDYIKDYDIDGLKK